MFAAKIRKVGNSHAVLLPAELIRRWNLEVGDEVSMHFDADRLIIAPAPPADRQELLDRLNEIMSEDDAILRELAK